MTQFIDLVAVVLIALAGVDWWAVAIVQSVLRRHPHVDELRQQRWRFGVTAVAASLCGVLGVNDLLGLPLPRGYGLILFAAALVLFSLPCGLFLVRYYRDRR